MTPLEEKEAKNIIRQFKTGATRDLDNEKLDYEAFLSPLALRRYAEYLHKHRIQADGTLRTGDNWQLGIPLDVYMKSLLRHVMEMWMLHRESKRPSWDDSKVDRLQDAICAVIFNAFGYLFEDIKEND